VESEWKRAGAMIARGESRFLSEGETVAIRLSPSEAACVTVAVVGARGLSFHARVDGRPGDDDEGRVSSVAGVIEIRSCGEAISRIDVTTDAGRGAIETIVAHSDKALPPLRSILPERSGSSLPAAEPGGLPPLPTPEKRAEVAEARAQRDGGKLAARDAWQAGADGSGEGQLPLEPGCHRVELFAMDPRTARASRRFRLDLDAELRAEDGALVLARDRTDAPDARLEACVGEATHARVVFAGSPPNAPIVVTHLSWPIPERLPQMWGVDTRARMAAALLAHHVPTPPGEAVQLAQGPSGLTPVPVALEPGGCYVAVAAVVRGHTRGLGMRALVGGRVAFDERGTNDDSAIVAFCARDRDRARIEVEARGVGVAWALAVFRTASGAWEGG